MKTFSVAIGLLLYTVAILASMALPVLLVYALLRYLGAC